MTFIHLSQNLSNVASTIKYSKEEIINILRSMKKYKGYTADKCLICKKSLTGKNPVHTCNSHSIPQFILSNMGSNYLNINSVIGFSLQKTTNGLNNAGTFRLLCSKCDNTSFQLYENPSIYNSSFRTNTNIQLILNQIAMKNHLYALYDHLVAKSMDLEYISSALDINDVVNTLDNIMVHTADIIDNKINFFRSLSNRQFYNVGYYHIYPRQFPLALQSKVTIDYDCWTNHINTTMDLSAPTTDMHVCVFPHNNKTIILVFSEAHSCKLLNTYEQLKFLQPDFAAKAIIAMSLYSSGNVYFLKNIEQQIRQDNYLKNLIGDNQTFLTPQSIIDSMSTRKDIIEKALSSSKELLPNFDKIPDYLIGL